MSKLERLYSPPEIGAPGKRAAQVRRRDLLLAAAFVFVMAVLAIAAVTLLKPGLFGRTYQLHTYFPDADGLTTGVQIAQSGYTIGILESVRPIFPGRDTDAKHCPPRTGDGTSNAPHLPCFRATLRILNDWPVPKGSKVRLGSAGILQGEVIMIVPGDSAERLAQGALIPSIDREPGLGVRLTALSDSIQMIVEQTIAPTLDSLKLQIKAMEGLIGTSGENAGNRERLAGAFTNLQQLTGNLAQAVDPKQIQSILGSVDQLSANLNQVSADLAERTGAIEQAVKQYSALAAEIRTLLNRNSPAIEHSLDDTQYLLQELSAALTPILTNVEDATRNLSALARDLRNNPAVIIQGHETEEDTPWFR